MTVDRINIDELEASLTKVKDWHRGVKNVINEEADQWLTDLEILTAELIAFERGR